MGTTREVISGFLSRSEDFKGKYGKEVEGFERACSGPWTKVCRPEWTHFRLSSILEMSTLETSASVGLVPAGRYSSS